ncbi:hypothetical protein FKW77_008969 [Venturia effusa]|uniref:EamA domain-containing protein n=1 Tax=Venturia effusa TaxID=50376 RepID=A0A517KX47_9PEZI|nr:hypothetical protein FKW77_008969 [Venturia effusa]
MATENLATSQPSPLNYVLGFLAVGLAWGFTTPFMRKAAIISKPISRPQLEDPNSSYPMRKLLGMWYAIYDLIARPAYSIPLLLNLSGSVWFFLLVGQAELSLTVPITNSLAFLFTVLGEWCVDGKAVSKDTWLGMVFVLTGIALCVYSKLDV